MNPLKRPANEELPPLRARKAARRPYVTHLVEQVELEDLSRRWNAFANMGLDLVKEVCNVFIQGVHMCGLLFEVNIQMSQYLTTTRLEGRGR